MSKPSQKLPSLEEKEISRRLARIQGRLARLEAELAELRQRDARSGVRLVERP
jgi:hypothetical protein